MNKKEKKTEYAKVLKHIRKLKYGTYSKYHLKHQRYRDT